MTYKVEYLLIVDKGNTRSVNSLRSLLNSDDQLTLTKKEITWNKHSFDYQLTTGSLKNQDRATYFNFTAYCVEEAQMEVFVQMLRRVRTQLQLLQTTVFTLWDDVSRHYSARAYHQIHYIENLMRKLLTKFMLINIGSDWNKDHSPDDVRGSINKENKDINYFNNVDFIKLSDFLFSENYPTKKQAVLEKLRTEDWSTLKQDELQALLPQSNWSKYFADLVECEGNYLEKRWKKLYKLRNSIAHNKQFSKRDAEEVERMAGEVGNYLEDALQQLEEVVVPEEDKETVLEDVAGEQNRSVRGFIRQYRELEYQVGVVAQQHFPEQNTSLRTLSYHAEALLNRGIFDQALQQQIQTLVELHHELVHGEEHAYSRNDWQAYFQALDACRDQVQTHVEYDEPYHLHKIKSPFIVQLYETFQQRLSAWKALDIRYNKHYISFVSERNVLDLQLQQRAIKIWLNAPKGQLNDPQQLTKDMSNIGHLGNGDYELRYTDADQLDDIMDLIKQTYDYQMMLKEA